MGRSFEGRVVVVTGASSGIGVAVAARFVAGGATVVAGSRSPAGIEGVEWIRTDVAEPTDCDALVRCAEDRNGRVDALVNCAGVQVEATVDQTTDADYDRVMDVNVRGTFNCCRAAVRSMKRTGGGVIINVGSIAGFTADHGMAAYNASKAAVHALTKSIAVDHGADRIRCNAVCPGWIDTAMSDAAFGAMPEPGKARAAAADRHPVGRLGTPEDVAGLVMWLCGDEAEFVTGSLFTIDGGLTAGSPI